MAEAIQDGISSVIGIFYAQTGIKKIGKTVSEACWQFREGIARPLMMTRARTYLRANVFTPQAILSALDLAGGVCSLKAYQIIYQIDCMSKDPYKGGKKNTILPHKWRVRQA